LGIEWSLLIKSQVSVVQMDIKHVFEVACHYFMLGIDWVVFWYGFDGLCAWTEMKLCYFHPSELLSPKWKLQNIVPGFASSIRLGDHC